MPIVDEVEVERSPELIAALSKRWNTTAHGLLLDSGVGDTPTWLVREEDWQRWLDLLDEELNESLGRKWAHAAAEDEEWRLKQMDSQKPRPFFAKRRKLLEWVNRDWELRGFGLIDEIDESLDEVVITVVGRTLSSHSGGMAAAVWEWLTGKRWRFRWEDAGPESMKLILEQRLDNIPTPLEIEPTWNDSSQTISGSAEPSPFDEVARIAKGKWGDGEGRRLLISRGLLLRFEEIILPTISDEGVSFDQTHQWNGLQPDRASLWSGMAKASSRLFKESGEMVLIAEPNHWSGFSRRHLSFLGLGKLTDFEGIDGHGGVQFTSPILFHPAITTGVLCGGWERAEGRGVKSRWTSSNEGHVICLEACHELA